MRRRLMIGALIASVASMSLLAYEVRMHQAMTSRALFYTYFGVNNADYELTDALLLSGFMPEFSGQFALESNDVPTSFSTLILEGVANEDLDDEEKRTVNHFFNPQDEDEEVLSIGAISPNWMLEEDPSGVEVGKQENGHPHFLDQVWEGLTSDSFPARYEQLSEAFISVGHLVHHMEDMAQPQHARNEDHCSSISVCDNSVVDMYNPSFYEAFSSLVYLNGTFLPYGSLNSGGSIRLSHIRDYWSVTGEAQINNPGIANYTGTNFVGQRSNFGVAEDDSLVTPASLPLPSPQNGAVEDYANIADRYPGLRADMFPEFSDELSMSFLVVPVVDAISGTVQSSNLTSTISWTEEVNGQHEFMLTVPNYLSSLEHLVPRGITYAAGMVDHLFRGRIRIRLPEIGALAIADHADIQQPGQGFKHLKVALRNGTPKINTAYASSEEEIGAGELYAVVTFRRNYCYDEKLEGEVFLNGSRPNGCDMDDYSDKKFEIATSKPIQVASLPRTIDTEVLFDFSDDVIPIEANSMYLSVYFRGALGEEEDAIAIGGVDISEPSFVTIMNHSDFFYLDGYFYTEEEIRNDPYLTSLLDENGNGTIDYVISPAEMEISQIAFATGQELMDSTAKIPAGGQARLVFLGISGQKPTLRVTNSLTNSPYVQTDYIQVSSYPVQLDRRFPHHGAVKYDQVREQFVYNHFNKYQSLNEVPTLADIHFLPALKVPQIAPLGIKTVDEL